jgi:hypothetical protein
MQYKSELYISVREHKDKDGKVTQAGQKLNIPVNLFEVDGGTNRKIDLGSPDEFSVGNEFEQARNYKNIIFYIPPTNDFVGVKLMELRSSGITYFDMIFAISTYSNGKLIKTHRFSAELAWLFRVPSVEGAPPLLKAWVRYHDAQLAYGQLDPKRGMIVHQHI